MERKKVAIKERVRTVRFRKMHGIGNDFVMVDCVRSAAPDVDPAELARAVCDRRFGVGADGLIYIEECPSPPTPLPQRGEGGKTFRMRMWNPDGSESEMCGNGIRCVARFLLDEGIVAPAAQGLGSGDQGQGSRAKGQGGSDDLPPLTPPSSGAGGRGIRIPVMTGAGMLYLEEAEGGQIRVDMGVARLTRGEIGMVGPADETFIDQALGTPHPLPLPPPGAQGGGESGAPSLAPPHEWRGEWRGTAVSMGNPHLVLILGSEVRGFGGSDEGNQAPSVKGSEVRGFGGSDEVPSPGSLGSPTSPKGEGTGVRGFGRSGDIGADGDGPTPNPLPATQTFAERGPLSSPPLDLSAGRSLDRQGSTRQISSGAGGRGIEEIDLYRWGPVLERHELFPNRTNVHFVEVVDRGHIVQRTWERGAGATLACGTGACASAVAAFLNGLTDRSVDVDLPGGRLHIDYAEDGRVFMTGPATTVFDGEWEIGV